MAKNLLNFDRSLIPNCLHIGIIIAYIRCEIHLKSFWETAVKGDASGLSDEGKED